MDQKNTIVKCNRSPKCLFEHNGVCDNYVINIGADGQCACYVETEESIFISTSCGDCKYFEDTGLIQCPCDKHEQYVYRKAPACGDFKAKRGQRAKCNFYDDTYDDKQTVITTIQDELLRQQMCWYCDNGSHGNCKLTAKPALDRTGKCPRHTSTGGNR